MGGAEPTLYGLDDAEGQAEVIFVEGEIDKLSLEVAGLRNAVRSLGMPVKRHCLWAATSVLVQNCPSRSACRPSCVSLTMCEIDPAVSRAG